MIRKSFTMIELAIVVVVLGLLSILAFKNFVDNQKNKDVEKIANEIVEMTKDYVLDTTIGYLNGGGGYCSNDNTFAKIDAYRAIQCAGFLDKPYHSKTYLGDTSEKNGNYNKCDFIIIPAYALDTQIINGNNTACRIHYYSDSSDSNILYIGINCSFIKSERKKMYLEKIVSSALRKNFPSVYESENFNWKVNYTFTGCSMSDSGGNDKDGELLVELKI